jgi:hypothetical protein
MGLIKDAYDFIYRDWVTDGIPASGANEPVKSEIRSLGSTIEQLLATAGISNTIYETPAAGIAATTNGQLFLVKGDGAHTVAELYKNVGGAAVSQGISLPSTAGIDETFAEYEMRVADALQQVAALTGESISYPGDPMVALRDVDDRLAPLIDGDGYPVAWLPEGFVPVMDGGRLAMSPGVVDGEALDGAFQSDREGGVLNGFGAMGGHFTLVGGKLERTNDRVFARKALSVRYESQTWTPGAQELLSRPIGANTAYLFIGVGQSNWDGHSNNNADALISDEPIYPAYALMLDGDTGPRIILPAGTDLVPLVEAVVDRGGGGDARSRETPHSGWANHFIRDYFDAWGAYPTVVSLSVAVGGLPYLARKKGSYSFTGLQEGVTNAVAALRARGFYDIRTVIGCADGEGDTTLDFMTKDRAKRQYRQFRREAGDIIRRITGELQDPIVIMVQTGNVLADPWSQPVRQAQVELDGEDGFVLAGPAYQYPMSGSAVPDDYHIHRGNLGRYSTGMQIARATMATIFGATWHGLKALNAYWTNPAGTQLTIECNSMGSALVEDTSGAISTTGLANKGLLFDDGSGAPPAITSVVLSGLKIIINFAAKPAGPRCMIGYALARNAGETAQDGPVLGARGTICDNVGYTRINDGATVYDWLPAFILDLPRP